MANIRLVTFSNQVVTPQNDGVIYNHTVAHDGMLTNSFLATIKNDTTVHLTWGLGMIAGREFEVQEQDITIPLSGGSATQGRLYFHMDLSNSSTPIDILFDTETTPLTYDDNVNVTNGVCEVELCHFTVNGISISDLVQTFNTLPSGASSVAYDGTSSGLSATDVQGAIDELKNDEYELPTASASVLGGVKVGANLTISGGTLSAKDTTYNNATTSAAGLMSAADKTKLSNIQTNANNIKTALGSQSITIGANGGNVTITNNKPSGTILACIPCGITATALQVSGPQDSTLTNMKAGKFYIANTSNASATGTMHVLWIYY